MRVDGQLYRAQLECRTGDLANTITGAIWFRTDSTVVKIATGSGYITLTSGAPDGTTLQNSADVWSVKALGIDTAQIQALAVTAAKIANTTITAAKIANATITTTQISATAGIIKSQMAALGQQVASSSSTFSMSSVTPATVTNQSVSITTLGRPVRIKLQSDGSGQYSELVLSRAANAMYATFQIKRDGSEIHRERFGSSAAGTMKLPPSVIDFIDTGASAASHTYTLVCFVSDAADSETIAVSYCTLIAYELT